jgi:enamine deaminase RidA (YjgF/YER057c/UK114 family)
MEINRFHVGKRLSEMAVHNGTIYLAGMVPANGTGIKEQTADVLAQIDKLLAEAGSDKSRILMAQIYITDLANFPGMNEVCRRRQYPAARDRRCATGPSRVAARNRGDGRTILMRICNGFNRGSQ